MSNSEQGHKITEQDILKVFDRATDPFLTASEVAAALPVSRQAVNYRLNQMLNKGLLGKKKTGARAVGWWAEVAPSLSDEATERVDKAREEIAAGDTVPLADLD